MSAGSIFERFLRLLRSIILARILVPEDFGLFAIITFVIVFLETVTEAGIRLSIIQNKKGDTFSYLNASWWFQSIRGTILFIIAIFFCPIISNFYKYDHLTYLLRISFLTIFFNSLVSPRVHLLERKLNFGKWTLLNQGSAFFGTIITILLALYLKSVWCFVIGMVAEKFIFFILSFILFPFYPRFHIDRDCLIELFRFAKGIFGLPMLNLIARQSDIFVLGKVVTPYILGNYYVAVQLAEQPIGLVSNVLPRLLLPIFSTIQEDFNKLKTEILSISYKISCIAIPVVFFIAINSYTILFILYGNDYTKAFIVLVILSINIFTRIQMMIATQALISIGKPNIQRKVSLIRTFLIVLFIFPAALKYGIYGASVVMAVSNGFMHTLQIIQLKRLILLPLKTYYGTWSYGTLLGLLVLFPNFIMFFSNHTSIILNITINTIILFIVIALGLYTAIFNKKFFKFLFKCRI